jgi:hypothetical protein
MTHDETKALIDKYHEKAIEVYNSKWITISRVQNVQIVERGAFVEAMVWIPKEMLDEQ